MTPHRTLRWIAFRLLVRPFLSVIFGTHVRNRERLPHNGPAILASNHNSHLDTLVILDLFPGDVLPKVRPAAAADYFLSKPWLAWIAIRLVGIVPVRRKLVRHKPNPLKLLSRQLNRGQILLFFPEGSRGEPEVLTEYKAGLARMAESNPECPVVPIYCHGLGKALPRGELLPVPFFLDVFVGEALLYKDFPDRKVFMEEYGRRMEGLRAQIPRPDYH